MAAVLHDRWRCSAQICSQDLISGGRRPGCGCSVGGWPRQPPAFVFAGWRLWLSPGGALGESCRAAVWTHAVCQLLALRFWMDGRFVRTVCVAKRGGWDAVVNRRGLLLRSCGSRLGVI